MKRRGSRSADGVSQPVLVTALKGSVISAAIGILLAAAPLHAQQDTTRVIPRDTVIRIEPVLVASTRTGRRIEDEPLRIEIVEREEIEEKLRMTPGDIAMLLNETGGVRVQSTAPSLGGAAVRIQGLRGRYAQILSDGLPLYGEATGLGALQIPPMDLGRVEVIKGPASALYGSAALGGVINLISRRPDGAVEALLNRTTRGGTDGVLWLSSHDDAAVGWTLLAGVHDQPVHDVSDDGWADIPGYTRFTARPRLFLGNERTSLMLTVGGTSEERSGGGVGGAVDGVRQDLETQRFDAGLIGNAWLGGMRAAVRAAAVEQRHTHGFEEISESDRHRTAFAEASLMAARGAHTVLLGAAVQHDEYRHDIAAFDRSTTIPGLFAQEEWVPADWLALSASARLDWPTAQGTLFSPRVSLLLRPGPWSIRASAGAGHHVPGHWIEEIDAIGLTALESATSLDVERARSASLDAGREIGPVELNATLFGSIVRDAVALRRTIEGAVVVQNVPGDTRTWGTELLARLHAESIHATLSYALTRATEPHPETGARREVGLTPRHTAGLVVAWEDEDRGRIGAELYYTGEQTLHDDPYRTRSRPYAVFGVLAERRFGAARVFVNFENIGNVRQTRYAPFLLPAPTTEGRRTTDAWAPLDGRVINAGVRLKLGGADEH
jgi:outer membrane receptor for ferrienterochelin and colicins